MAPNPIKRMAASGDVAANDGLDVDVESENELSIASTSPRDARRRVLRSIMADTQKRLGTIENDQRMTDAQVAVVLQGVNIIGTRLEHELHTIRAKTVLSTP